MSAWLGALVWVGAGEAAYRWTARRIGPPPVPVLFHLLLLLAGPIGVVSAPLGVAIAERVLGRP